MPADEEVSYGELLSNLALNGELIITIPIDKEEEVKNGLKNLKSKQLSRVKDAVGPQSEEVLFFSSTKSKEYEDCIDLRIQLKKKGVVLVKKLVIPDNSFD